MDLKTYQTLAMRTESTDFGAILGRIAPGSFGDSFTPVSPEVSDPTMIRLLHFTMGLQTEIGELTDQLKRHIFYGADLDLVNLQEELGDLSWYMAGVAMVLEGETGQTWDDALAKNILKLAARYGDKFSEDAAILRDLGAERKVLEATE